MELILLIFLVCCVLAFILINKYRDSIFGAVMTRSSVLFAYLTKGNMLLRADRGIVNGLFYEMYITMNAGPLFGEPAAPGGAIIYRLELPFNTQGHLLGISNLKHTTKQASIEFAKHSGLEAVDLEGDFDKYFSLFTAEGQGTHARYIFDPAAMHFVASFCANHDWEIVYDELYLTVAEDQKGGEIIKKSIAFIDQIKPAIIKEFPTKASVKNKAPYGEWRGEPMYCPICKNELINNVHLLECPNGHGRLVHAQKLIGFRKGQIKHIPKIEQPAINERPTDIECPHCKNKMVRTQYAQKGLIIDSCTKCPWRWLDAGELAKILPKN